MKRPIHHEWLTRAAVGTAMVLLITTPAHAGYKGELIPFPQVLLHQNSKEVPPLEQHGSYAAVNFFYTGAYQQTRLLAELYVDSEEREAERLALGWISPEGTQLWFGRFHSALDQWNRKHHHGAYLQTTIYRPGLIEFEDDGGVIPAHLSGATIETAYEEGARITHCSLDLGLGPELIPGQLKALDIFNPHAGQHKLSAIAAMSSHSIDSVFDGHGLFAGYIDIPSSASGINNVTQKILGAYLNGSHQAWHLGASVTWVEMRLDLTAGDHTHESFTYGYLQPEYWLDAEWTLYGRAEGGRYGQERRYLQQIPMFVGHRTLAGVRYQFSNSQALKFELATLDQYGQRFHQAAMQWSAALP